MATTKELTTSDIERYAAQFGDDCYLKLGVLLATVESLMSDDRWKRDAAKRMLREWAGGEAPNKIMLAALRPFIGDEK